MSCHILLLQETHLRPGEHAPLEKLLPPGYRISSVPRPVRSNLDHGHGGVAAIFHDSIPVECRYDLSGADIQILQLPNLNIINAYLFPEASRGAVNVNAIIDPCQKLEEVISGLRESNLPLLIMGDLNARTGTSRARPEHPQRCSQDSRRAGDPRGHLYNDSRGNWLLRIANESKLCILNGAVSVDKDNGGLYTSHQHRGEAVVDYCLLSQDQLDTVLHFSIERQSNFSDHSVLRTHLNLPLEPKLRNRTRRYPCTVDDLLLHDPYSPADIMLLNTMEESTSWSDAMLRLYGAQRLHDPHPIHAYTDGSCLKAGTDSARAGLGVYFGPHNLRNISERVPGKQQTNNRAELFAILRCLESVDSTRGLEIFTDSEYSIRSIGEWAASRAELGWNCPNGDVLHDIHLLIRQRHAHLRLVWVKAHSTNQHNEEADRLAKLGAMKPIAAEWVRSTGPGCSDDESHLEALPTEAQTPKVSIDIPERRPTANGENTLFAKEVDLSNEPWFQLRDHSWTQDPSRWQERRRNSHRFRAIRAQLRHSNLQRLEIASKDKKQYWNLIREWCSAKRAKNEVDPDLMTQAVEQRLNGPESPPPDFDKTLLKAIQLWAKSLPAHTEDLSEDKIFSRAFTIEEMAAVKMLLLKNIGSAEGIDTHTYTTVLKIPNFLLARLFTHLLQNRVIPNSWLVSILAAVPKAKGPYTDPENFRIISLECCLLKMMTLLLDRRIRDFAERNGSIPPTQNGFRPGYRTENNPFILRTAIEVAQAQGKTLFVAFVDLRNAFPSVNRDILWLKMWNMGIHGPVLDWIRRLYEQM